MTTATAQSFANIAFIKYWGNRDNTLSIPMNGSLSMNLDGLYTRTTVSFQPSLPFDELIINGHEIRGAGWGGFRTCSTWSAKRPTFVTAPR